MAVTHLYIHVPFCQTRCHYCDFFSTGGSGARAQAYLAALLHELHESCALLGRLETVYVGGGTPTFAGSDFLTGLLEAVAPLVADGVEVTVEANPASLDGLLAQALASAGVTRISLGAQSFDPRLRERIGRKGSVDGIAAAASAVRDSGIDGLGLDMLFALPGQTAEMLSRDLERALELAPDHISCYELTVARDSVLAKLEGEALELAQARAGEFYGLVSGKLEAAGYRWYETSNYARPGSECRHNLACWSGDDYLGIGAGAWSTVGSRRWRNIADLEGYIASPGAGRVSEPLDRRQKLAEALMLGLRKADGVELDRVKEVVDAGQLADLTLNGFVAEDGARIFLTRAGRFVANEVCARLLR
ncbi:MAG: radical SAM family heme chaperone HemW [Gaiellales bacterium]|nr:MAG: radical SAM family heme chaperone HemW [Gaiellales bacterium]